MTRSEQKKFGKIYKDKIERAARLGLGATDSAALKSAVDEIDSYSKIQARLEGHWANDWKVAVGIALFCLLVTYWLWATRVPKTNVSMTVDTQALRGTLTRDWLIDSPFQASAMHLENLSVADAPSLGLRLHGTGGDSWFKLEGGTVSLGSLKIDKAASVQITANKSEVSFFVTMKPVRGTITVLGKGNLMAGEEPGHYSVRREYALTVPETINFAAQDPKGIPARITVHMPQKPWSAGRAPFGYVGFALEEPKDISEHELISGIQSGSVLFNDTTWPAMALSEDQIVSAHQTSSARIELHSGDDGMHVLLNGAVKDVSIGDAENHRELAPSRLEYLYNKKSLAVFWGAIVFVWGVLWGIRKTIFR